MTSLPRCSCAHNVDGSVTLLLCPVHALVDPCYTISAVTGKRRKGSTRRGPLCTNCGWTVPPKAEARDGDWSWLNGEYVPDDKEK